jgi:DNA-directed RNA polymerase specialized sigma subunit
VDLDAIQQDGIFAAGPNKIEKLLILDEALSRLKLLDERHLRIVEMRFFGGMTDKEIADVLGLSERTIVREWGIARAWLHSELSK